MNCEMVNEKLKTEAVEKEREKIDMMAELRDRVDFSKADGFKAFVVRVGSKVEGVPKAAMGSIRKRRSKVFRNMSDEEAAV